MLSRTLSLRLEAGTQRKPQRHGNDFPRSISDHVGQGATRAYIVSYACKLSMSPGEVEVPICGVPPFRSARLGYTPPWPMFASWEVVLAYNNVVGGLIVSYT